MEIIPVLDLKAGRVVHARGGARNDYLPLQSPLCPDGEALRLLQTLQDNYTFKRIYIADLDAITKTGNHIDQIGLLQQSYPQIEFWIDSGIRTAACLHQFYRQLPGIPVIGSETLNESELPALTIKHEAAPILSLDFNANGFLGPEALLHASELWPDRLIIMSLDHVGMNTGPDLIRLRQYKKYAGNHKLFAAGGIRNDQDLCALAKAGIDGALVATGLHNGQITTGPCSG